MLLQLYFGANSLFGFFWDFMVGVILVKKISFGLVLMVECPIYLLSDMVGI